MFFSQVLSAEKYFSFYLISIGFVSISDKFSFLLYLKIMNTAFVSDYLIRKGFLVDVKREELLSALIAQLEFVRDGYSFIGDEAQRSYEFERNVSNEVLRCIGDFQGISELEQFLESYCSSLESLNINYLRLAKTQIIYAVKQNLL